ncbi:MAG TPA: PAS domain S-box protein [Kofleriaceae bacterium]|nr:PAS domain S-box protein [Kofleriaceae bacterium]
MPEPVEGEGKSLASATAASAPASVEARRIRRLIRCVPLVCGGGAVAVAAVVLAGWWSGRRWLASPVPGLPVMVANSALMAALLGAALLLSASSAPAVTSRRGATASKACAGIVAGLAAGTLVEYAFDLDLRIDHVLIVTGESLTGHYPGRPSPQTAAACLLAAAALLILDPRSRRGQRLAELLALASGLIPLMALLGFLFGAAALYGTSSLLPYTGMGLLSAVTLLALSTGIVASTLEGGVLFILIKEDSGGTAARHLAASLLVFTPVVCVIAIGARLGLYAAPFASALVVLTGIVGGSAFVLRVSGRLSRLDAARREADVIRARLSSLVSSSDDVIIAETLDGRITDWNSGAQRTLGYSAAEMLGRPSSELWPPALPQEQRAQLDAIHDAVRRGQRAGSLEAAWRHQDGHLVPVLVTLSPLLDSARRVFGVSAIAQDITSRKRLEEELRVSEARSSGILAISADAIISVDDDLRITMFNAGAVKIFGYSTEEAIGASLDILIPERVRAIHREHVARFAAGQEVARKMGQRGRGILGRRKNGEEFHADAAISKLDVAGTRLLTVALRDVSEQRRSEDESTFLAEIGSILASSLELEATLASVGKLITRALADICIVYVLEGSHEVRRIQAATRDPAQGWLRDYFVQHPFDRRKAPPVWAEMDAHRSILLPRMSPEWIASYAQDEAHARALRAMNMSSAIMVPLVVRGRLIGAMSLVASAPARAYTPADVRFAEQVAQRAAFAIENARLYDTAQRAIRTRDEVLGIVAHDLRGPLGTIQLYAESLRELPAEPAHHRRPAEVIERCAKRMNRLIQDLLDVTQMEAGRLSVEHARVAAGELVDDIVEAHRPLAAAASLELHIDAARDLPDVWADRDRLQQVFENLIGNAIKFSGPGHAIRVGAAPREGEVLFWVADSGGGIASEDLPRVFDRFWQARRAGRHGAGLGLPIVKGIVEAHGGRIWVESAPGLGSTFFFAIPAAPRAEDQPAR